jgi:hypothetical protein
MEHFGRSEAQRDPIDVDQRLVISTELELVAHNNKKTK